MVFRDERSPRLYFHDRIGDHDGLSVVNKQQRARTPT
jgi:hypothetical protein